MHNPDPISTYYVNEAQRFDKDFAVADKQKRGQELGRWEIKIDHLRKERLQRENTRWDHIETNNQKDDKRLHVRKELYHADKKNKGGASYNIVSLAYENTKEGQKLKLYDDDAKVRAMIRSKNLDTKNN